MIRSDPLVRPHSSPNPSSVNAMISAHMVLVFAIYCPALLAFMGTRVRMSREGGGGKTKVPHPTLARTNGEGEWEGGLLWALRTSLSYVGVAVVLTAGTNYR